VFTDEIRLADELDARAAAKEEEAARLREAAAILRGVRPPGGEVMLPLTAVGAGAAYSASIAIQQRSSISEVEYLRVIQAFDRETEWTAQTLASRLQGAGKAVASIDAVRTALARLHSKGLLERVGHGRYKLAHDVAIAEVSTP